MGFYDNFPGGLIGGGKQNEYALSGIQTLNNSIVDIVRGNLELHLDTLNLNSYPGSGTTWTDLSGNARNGTLTNGPTFTADLYGTGGYITLDGTNDLITVGQNFNYTTQSFSIGMWVRFINFDATGGYNPVLFWKGSFQISGYYCEVNPSNGTINFYTNQGGAAQLSQALYNANPTSRPNTGLMGGEWYNIYITRNGTGVGSVKIYINAVDRTTTSANHLNISSASTNTFQIGRYDASVNYPNIDIASFIIYQRALSDIELLQNFNASRRRFGL